MPAFHYRALNKSGEMQTGSLEAASLALASSELHRRGMIPLELSPGGKTLAMRLNEPVELFDKPGPRVIFAFLRDLSRLLKAGLSMDDALKLLAGMQNKPLFNQIVVDIRDRVRRGEGLATAMSEYKQYFPVQTIASVQAGELSGALPDALETLATAMDNSLSFQERLRSALIYPAILMVMVAGTFVLVMTFVLPQFAPIFEGNEDRLPIATRFVMALAHIFETYSGLIGLGILALAAWIFAIFYHQPLKAQVLKRLCGIPFLRSWLVTPEVVRFVRTLGVCNRSGLALDKSIAMAIETVKIPHLSEALGHCRRLVRRGDLLSTSLERLGWVPPLALQFTRVGEQSGNLGTMLEEAATILANDYQARLEKGLEILSPVLTLVMGSVVALLVGSVLLGIMSINDVAL